MRHCASASSTNDRTAAHCETFCELAHISKVTGALTTTGSNFDVTATRSPVCRQQPVSSGGGGQLLRHRLHDVLECDRRSARSRQTADSGSPAHLCDSGGRAVITDYVTCRRTLAVREAMFQVPRELPKAIGCSGLTVKVQPTT